MIVEAHIARLEASQRKEIEWKVVRSIARASCPRLSVWTGDSGPSANRLARPKGMVFR
jgi:hypothetical protein